jgi:hypothetical protein
MEERPWEKSARRGALAFLSLLNHFSEAKDNVDVY